MRLTTLCVCGTLLALSSWIRAEDGPHLGDRGFGPCAASLKPGGACRPGQRDSTCPYLLSLPPLTVHLPQHLRELENIMQDLQKLKDSVEELRKMCADCTESRTERKCVGRRDKEQEKQTEGEREDVRSWMNVRLEEAGRSFKQEGGSDGEKVGKTDGDNSKERSLILEEKGRNKWGADRKSNKGVVKENEREEAPTDVGERDGKTRKEAARGEDRLEQEKVPTAGGNTRTVDVTSGEVFETTHRESTDLLDALKGNLKGFQEDKLENAEEKNMPADVKRKEKTKEDGDPYVWRDEINKTDKKTKTEASDGIKMSENHESHEENINKEQEHREETRQEKGIKVDQNNEKLKHAESTGHTGKEKAIKEREEGEKGREMGTEIKTKSVQRNVDGVLHSRKTTEGTDISSVSPTLSSTLASNLDPNKVTIFTSSLPSPPLPSSTLSSITDVIHDTKAVYGSTQSTGLGAAHTSEPEGHDADLARRTSLGEDGQETTGATAGLNSAFTVKPGAGLQQGYQRSTTTSPTFTAPHRKLNATASPRVTDQRSWTPKKNVSLNIKTGLKPPPGRVLRPGDKHKPGIKPEAEQKLKNPKNDRKPNHAPAPDKKTKYNQKQKPPPHRSTSENLKPGHNSENIHNSKFIRKTPPQISATNRNLRNNLTRPSPQNKLPFQKPNSALKSPTSVQKAASQRPQTVNASRSDKESSMSKQHVPGEAAVIHQKSKSETRLVHSFMTNQPDQKETPEKDQTKPDEKFDLKRNVKPQSDSKRSQTESFTAKPNQRRRTESVKTSDENPSQELEPNSNVRPGQKITSDAVNESFDQMNKSSQEIPERKPKLKPVQEPENNKSETATLKPNNKRLPETVEKLDENPFEESNLDSIPGQKITFNATFDQTNKSSQEISQIKPKPTDIKSSSKTETAASKHNKQPSTESETKSDKTPVSGPEPDQDLLPGHKTTFDQVNATSDQMNTSSQETPQTEHQPERQETKTKSETGTLNLNQKPLTEEKSAKDSAHEPESNQDLNYSQTTSSRGNAKKSSQEMSRTKPKTKPELTEEPTSETETAIPKPDRKPSTESVFNKDAAQEPESIQDLTSGQKLTSDQINETTEQITSGEGIPKIKHQSKPDQDTNKSKTGAPNPNRKPLAEDKSAENPLQEPESHQDLNYDPTNTSSRVTATSDQKPESSQVNFSIKHKPKLNQELKPKTETTPKPDQNPSTGSVVDKKSPQEPEQDSLPGKKNTSDQVHATPNQIIESNQDDFKIKPKPNQEPKKSETATLGPKQKPLMESAEKSGENPLQEAESNKDSTSGQTHAPDKAKKVPVPKIKPIDSVPNVNKRPKPGPEPKQKLKHPKDATGLKNKPNTNVHTERTPQTNSSLKTPRPEQTPDLKTLFKPKNNLTAKPNRTSEPRTPFQHKPWTRPLIKPGAKPVQRLKPPVQPKLSPKTNKTHLDQPKISWAPSENNPNSQPDMPPTSGSAKQIPEVTHSPLTDFSTSTRKTVSQGPKTSDSLDREHSPRLHTHTEDFLLSPNSRTVSDLRPQTARQPPSIPMTTRPNKIHRGLLHRVITSTSPGSTQTSPVPKADFSAHDKIHYNREETAPANLILSPSLETTSTPSPDLSSTTRATSGFEPSAAEPTTPSARELRVKINQVTAFVNNSLNPNRRVGLSNLEGSQRGSGPDTKRPTSVQTKVMRDCSDHLLRGDTRSGLHLVTPDLRSSSFQVFCDMERAGGGWTLVQRRQDGSVSFNRTWAEYQSGFGQLDGGEFWLGNRMIHLLTRDRDMALRVELEDFDGVAEHAQYEQFRVAGERQRYKLTVGAYSGTAGDALRFSKSYDHNNRAFTAPDRDHDRYPSGNCGAYYGSGWWFDSCMAANLNGKYYIGNYKGVRDGIFWGTWHNISKEYYPTNKRQSFKSVRMMIRPKGFAPEMEHNIQQEDAPDKF